MHLPGNQKAIPSYSLWTKTVPPKQGKRDTEVPFTPFYITFLPYSSKLELVWFLFSWSKKSLGLMDAFCLWPASCCLSGCPEALQADRYCSSLHSCRVPGAGLFVVRAKTPRFEEWWEHSWVLDGKSTQVTACAQLPPHGEHQERCSRAGMEWIKARQLLSHC